MRVVLAAMAVALVVAVVAGCGGSDSGYEQPTMTLDPHPPRAVAPGQSIRIKEDGESRPAGDELPKLRTAKAAREACGAAPSVYVAWTYGVASRDLDVIADVIAKRRAAPGYLTVVRDACRAGLHRQGDRSGD
jgi:hypothetical protein